MKVLTLTTDLNHPGFLMFQKSFKDYDVHVLNPQISDFGFQMPYVIEWCRNNPDVNFVYSDAWDTIALGSPEELKEKIGDCEFYGGAERGCWPDANLIDKFPNLKLPYKYLCGGTWYSNTNLIVEMAERSPNTENMYDQHWLQICYLNLYNEGRNVKLDHYGAVFQSLMLDPVEAFKIEGRRVKNVLHDVYPVILHGNGKTNMERYYELI